MPPQQTATAFDSVQTKSRRSIDTISALALIVTLVAVLFIFIPAFSVPLITTKTYLLAAGTLITLAVYIFARLARGNAVFPPLALVGALWLPVVAYALSAFFSGVRFSNAFWGTTLEPDTLGFIFTAAGAGTLTALVLRRDDTFRSFIRVGAYAFGLVALLQALVIILGQFVPNTISPAFSIIGSYADLASFLGLGVIAALIASRFLALSSRTNRALVVGLVVSLVLLAIANSPLVWVLVALVSLGLFVESVMKRGSKGSDADLDDAVIVDEAPVDAEGGNRSLVLPLSVLAVSLFFLIGGTLGNALATSLHINILNVRPSWQSTFSVAHSALAASPVFGSGPNTFGSAWLKYRDASLNTSIFWNVDFSSGIGFIPTSFVTTGILGILAWVGFFGLFLVLGVRTLVLRAPKDVFIRFVSILSFLASVYLFTIAVFDLPNAIILALAFIFAGLFISTTRFAGEGKQWGIVFSRSPRLGFVIVFSLTILLLSSVVAGYTLVGHYLALKQLADANTAFSQGNLVASKDAAQSSISFAPTAAAYKIQAGVAVASLNQIVASTTLSAADAQKQFKDTINEGLSAAVTATQYDPNDYQNWLAVGNLYSQAVPLGDKVSYDSAATAYKQAESLNPTNPQIPYVFAQLDILHKDNKSAEADLKQAIALKPDFTNAIFLLSQLEIQDGNLKDALARSIDAAYLAQKDPNILFQVGILSAAAGDIPSAIAALQGSVDANPKFANARYYLAAAFAKQGNLPEALKQIQAVSDISTDNAKAVAPLLTQLQAGKNPFPASLLAAASSTPVAP